MVASPFTKQNIRFSCQHCNLRQLCFPVGLSNEELSTIDEIISQQKVVKRHERLFKQGDAFKGLCVVRSGAFKYYHTVPGQNDHIIAFYLPGEFFGLDAVHNEEHPATAQALTDSSVCIISFDELMKLASTIPTLQRYLMDIVSKRCANEITHRPNQHHTAEQRLVMFLMGLSKHFAERGYSAHEFQLPMSRKDIADYLDLADETISRLFKTLQGRQWIKTEGKLLNILNLAALQQLTTS
jgi:CRP/FNR family transcriptional regulator